MKNSRKWIIDWFIKNGNLSEQEVIDNMNENYIEKSLIDSFGFIQLLSDISEVYGREFDDEDFDTEKFFTISGLIDLLGEGL